MLAAIQHRGPDWEGVASGPGWAVGNARLAIIDISGGNQPIWNEDKTIVIVGNNEIYNAPELRKKLEANGHRFSTHSDTEVALHGWEQWDTKLFEQLNGMFA
ncbi:MAG: asparagine synthetase B, partial [Deltaproteobacteria bacterium]|nr:asparagine synthetase B [Deltaproteobacteria bacterium]